MDPRRRRSFWAVAALAGGVLAGGPGPGPGTVARSAEAVETLPGPVVNPVEPAVVAPLEAQCGAARASSLGDQLDARRAGVTGPRHALHVKAAKKAHLERVLLSIAAEEARNQDAGTALELYWSLAEAEHLLTEISVSEVVADRAVADRAALAARGVDLPVDEATLLARRLTLDDGRTTAEGAVESISPLLAQLCGLPPGPVRTVHPSTARAAVDEPIDVDGLVAEGLARRPQLRLLRAALAHLDDDTAEQARLALSLVSPIAAGGGDRCRCNGPLHDLLHRRQHCAEKEAIRRQLRELLADREAAVEAEIRQAAAVMGAAVRRVAIAERLERVASQAAADARSRAGVGATDAFTIHVADLEVSAARRAVIERMASWERARAKVWRAQGLLAAPCET